MKFCIDCVHSRYFYENQGGGRTLFCVAGIELLQDPVYGYKYYPRPVECAKERAKNICGVEGTPYKRKWWKFWRPK